MPKSPKSHCIHGHEMAGPNIYYTREGKRLCRTCRSDRDQAVRGDRRVKKSLEAVSKRLVAQEAQMELNRALELEAAQKLEIKEQEDNRKQRVQEAWDRRWERGPETQAERDEKILEIFKVAKQRAWDAIMPSREAYDEWRRRYYIGFAGGGGE